MHGQNHIKLAIVIFTTLLQLTVMAC